MQIKNLFVFIPGEIPNIAQQLQGVKATPRIEKLINLIKPKLERSGKGEWRGFGMGGFDVNYAVVVIAKFEVDDFDIAESAIMDWVADTEFDGQVRTYQCLDDRDENDGVALCKSIEICYDISAIPTDGPDPLDFRNAAMVIIEAALENADAGEWAGAESGANEVNFGFDVDDFETAEKIVRDAVKGTPYDCIRKITRYDSSDH